MRSFTHLNASTVGEACGLLAEMGDRAVVNAGGTDLLGTLKDGIHVTQPEVVINLKTIPGQEGIRRDGRWVHIGALTGLSTIAGSDVLQDDYAVLTQAARSVATPQIRNMGTLGGNLCQEVRCWYYRYPRHLGGPVDCLRKGGKGCPAVKGDNRYHAIFGGRGCHAVCPSDMAVALAALGATAVIAGPGGSSRELPVEDLYAVTRTTVERGELVTEVRVPSPPKGAALCYLKSTIREPVDFALVSVASNVTIRDGICEGARIVLGAVSARPYRATAAEDVLQGASLDAEVVAEAATQAVSGAKPMRGNSYKVQIARTLVERALLTAIDGT